MYGTIRKSYSISKASHNYEDNTVKGLAEKNNKAKRRKIAKDELQKTSYIKINEEAEKSVQYEAEQKNEGIYKNEFPVASIILTIVFTMMVLVFAFGFGGI